MEKNEDLRKAYGMFTDAWRLYRKYADTQQGNGYWEALVAEAHAVVGKYQGDRMCRELVLAAVSALERKGREGCGR